MNFEDLIAKVKSCGKQKLAVAAAEAGFSTICLTLVPPRRSHSSAAQGGMQAAHQALVHSVFEIGAVDVDAHFETAERDAIRQ